MNLSASPEIITIEEKEYEIHPLTEGQIGALSQWVRGHFLKSVRLSLVDEKNATEKKRFEREAFAFSLEIEWNNTHGKKALATKDGLTKLLYESLKKSQPSITMMRCWDLINVDGAEKDFWDAFVVANDMQVEDDAIKKKTPPDDPPSPTA